MGVVRKQSSDGDQSDAMQFILGAEDTSKIVFAKLISDAQVPAIKNLMNKWAKFEPLLQEFDGLDHWITGRHCHAGECKFYAVNGWGNIAIVAFFGSLSSKQHCADALRKAVDFKALCLKVQLDPKLMLVGYAATINN